MNRVLIAFALSSFTGLIGCKLESNLDPNAVNGMNPPPPYPGGALGPQPPGPPIAPGHPLGCEIDTRQVVESQGRFFEVLTSRGRLFEFENGAPVQPGVGLPNFTFPQPGAIDLTTVPLYAQGPCAGHAPGTCAFDTQAFVVLPGSAHIREYVTAFGRQWVFEGNTATGNAVPLDAIPRYDPICQLSYLTGGICTFDTRTFVKLDGILVESITAYGRIWEFDIDGRPLPDTGIDLSSIPEYQVGPCAHSPPGQCVFETRTFEPLNGQLVETITVNGFVYRYVPNGAPLPGSGVPIATAFHWASGPCQ